MRTFDKVVICVVLVLFIGLVGLHLHGKELVLSGVTPTDEPLHLEEITGAVVVDNQTKTSNVSEEVLLAAGK